MTLSDVYIFCLFKSFAGMMNVFEIKFMSIKKKMRFLQIILYTYWQKFKR